MQASAGTHLQLHAASEEDDVTEGFAWQMLEEDSEEELGRGGGGRRFGMG
jgi:hypothetical protein